MVNPLLTALSTMEAMGESSFGRVGRHEVIIRTFLSLVIITPLKAWIGSVLPRVTQRGNYLIQVPCALACSFQCIVVTSIGLS